MGLILPQAKPPPGRITRLLPEKTGHFYSPVLSPVPDLPGLLWQDWDLLRVSFQRDLKLPATWHSWNRESLVKSLLHTIGLASGQLTLWSNRGAQRLCLKAYPTRRGSSSGGKVRQQIQGPTILWTGICFLCLGLSVLKRVLVAPGWSLVHLPA